MAITAFACAGAPAAYAANFSCSWTDAGDNWTTAADWSACNGTSPNNSGGNTYDATISNGGSPTLTSPINVGNVTVSGSTWLLQGPSGAATLTGNLANSGNVDLDIFGGDGGASLGVGGTLTNSGNVQIGSSNDSLSANTTVTANAVNNTGTINLYGNGTKQAALKVSGSAGFGTAGVISGQVNLQDNSLVQFGSGGLSSIASGGQLSLNGAGAQVQIAGNSANNNALTGLSSNAGTFYLRNGAAVTTTTGLNNSNNLFLDIFGGDGGASLGVGGTLTNSGNVQIGSSNDSLSANTTVTANAVNNTGTINLYGNGTKQAALKVSGAAGFGTAGVISGQVNLQDDSLVQFGSGGLSSIASGGQLSLNGASAQVQIAGNSANNNALDGLSSNAGFFYLRNGAAVTTTTGLNNSNNLLLDTFGNDGGASLGVGGTLTNSGLIQIGSSNNSLSANTTVSANVVNNTGTISLFGNGTNQAALDVGGSMTNSNTVNINGSSTVSVTGAGNAYAQTAGTTNIAANGTLTAPNVNVTGGTLRGDGTVIGNLNVNSAGTVEGVNPNNGNPDTLTVNGSYNQTGGTLAALLQGTGAGQVGTVAVGNSVNLGGGTLQANFVNGLIPTAGQNFNNVVTYVPGSLSGLFAALQNGNGSPSANPTYLNLGGGLTLGVNYNNSAGNVQLQVVNTPATTAENWNGGTGNWSTGSGWSSGSSPTFYSDVGIGLTGSGNVTLNQDGTINSLAIHNGNTLQYQAATAQTLTVGTNVTVDAGGALSMTTAGDKLAVGGTVGNAGTMTVGSGTALNVVNLGNAANALTNQSGAQIQLGGNLVAAQGAVANNSGATVAMQGGTLAAASFANAGTTSGFGTIVPAVANTGLVQASGGTLTAQNGIQGLGNITVNPAGTLDLSQSAAGSSAATLAVNGNLNLGAQNLTVSTAYTNANFGTGNGFNKNANVTGPGQILAAGNVAQAVNGGQVTNGTDATPTLALGNVHVGSSTSANYTIANTGSSGPSLSGAIQTSVNGGNITNSALSGSGVTAQNFGPLATGASTSPFTVTYAPTTAGALTGQTVHIANNFGNVAEQTMSITGAAYALASPTVTSSLTPQFNFGVVQVGQTINDPLTIKNVQVASNAAFQEGLAASFGTPSTNFLTTNNGSIANLAPGATDNSSLVVSLHPTGTGTVSGSVPLTLTSVAVAGTGLSNTDLSQTLSYNWQFSGTVVNQANPSITRTTINFGNVRINSLQQQALNISNIAGTPPQASLDAQISAVGPATSNNGTISLLAPGSQDTTSLIAGLSTTAAGAQSGIATVALQSNSTPNGCISNCTVNLSSQNIAVQGNVYRLANPVLNTASVSLAARVGGPSPSGAVSLSNSSPDIFTEGLKASFGASPSAAFAPSGNIANLAAQGTDNGTLKVALNTGTAGTFSGPLAVNFTSTGAGTDNAPDVSAGSGNVALSGNVYTPAVANVLTTSPIDFGIVHVKDPTQTRSVTVQNGATATALNDVLIGSVSTSGAPFSGSGNLGAGLGPQAQSSALQTNLSTTAAGIFTGTASLVLASHDAHLADLPLSTSPLALHGQVNNYAALALLQQGGQGSLTGGASAFDLDFGTVLQGSPTQQALLAFLNDNPLADQAFTDLLSSMGVVVSGAGFTISGDSVSDLAGGTIQGGFDIGFDTSNLGNFTEMLSFNIESSNSSNYDQIIGSVTLTLEGNVVSSVPTVPEPGTMSVLVSGLGAVFFVIRRRRRAP